MARWLSGCLILAVFAAAIAPAQESTGKKSDEPRKSNVEPLAKKKGDEAATVPTTPRDDTNPAGGKIWLTPEKYKDLQDRYQKLQEQFNLLEKQLKKDKTPPSVCKLSGKFDGDAVTLKAEFAFAVTGPQMIFLGLKNGFLVDEGRIDDAVPHLEATDDGYFVLVDKSGPHRLTLNLRVPVIAKKGVATTGNERGFDLGLPGAAVTTLALQLPGGVKDIRSNDAPVKNSADLTLGALKNVSIVWREPAANPSVAVGPTARANIKVRLKDSEVELLGDLVLEDAKTPNREWHLLLPPQVELTQSVGGSAFQWQRPENKSAVHIVRSLEPSEKLTLSLAAKYARTPGSQKIPVGPILVQEAPMQGTILVQAVPGVLRGQRLSYQRYGETFQRDPPKSSAGFENLTQFQYWNAPFSGKGLSPTKAPLEIEWKLDKGQILAAAEHDVKAREDRGQWIIDVETKLQLESASSGSDVVELQFPPQVLPDVLWMGTEPLLGFPGVLRWPMALTPRPTTPISINVLDDSGVLDLSPLDAQQRTRVKLSRPIGKEMSIRIQSRYWSSSDTNRLRVDLPKIIGVLDRGAKLTVWPPAGYESLVGPVESSEPLHDKYQQSFEQMPNSLELAWRASVLEKRARAIVDVSAREQGVHVRQTILLPAAAWSGGRLQTGQVAFRLPTPGFRFTPINVPPPSIDKNTAWLKLPAETNGHFEIQLEFDTTQSGKDQSEIAIPILWPEAATIHDAKLRVWTAPGMTPSIQGMGESWKDRPLEAGPEATAWPALVAESTNPANVVTLTLSNSAQQRLPAMVAERSLIQTWVDDDGVRYYRCRFLVRKFSGTLLDVELPASWDLTQARFRIGGKSLSGIKVIDTGRHVLRLPLAPHLYPQPALMEIEYQLPAGQGEGRRLWQTTLLPPRFVGDVILGPVRWQAAFSGQETPFLLGSSNVDYRWAINGWLLCPEPSVTSDELDAWIGGEVGESDNVALAWWRGQFDVERVYHFPRQAWLMVCSGTVLVTGLILLLVPMPRWFFAFVVVGLGLGAVALGLYQDYVLPVVFFGAQPGLVVLIAVAAGHALVRARAEWRARHVPSFSRVSQGSTFVRQQPKPSHASSTIDAPAPSSGSSKSQVS
jgi:hypothetical protein